ncbi:MAG: tripartite tricarboxylate transporter substrate binding protein [Pseudomonadota bacterium]
MKRVGLTLALLMGLLAGNPAQAQDKFPSKPIKILLPYGAGSATDIITRIMCEQLRQILGQSCVVENKPGAFGIIAIEEMARSKPDGYTLQVGNVSTNAITPVLFKDKFGIDYEKDVVAIARLADIPTFMMMTAKIPPKTLAEFVAYAKERPGKLKYASPGAGSFPHYDMEIFSQRAGIKMEVIHIKAGPPGYINDMTLGDIHVSFMNVATSAPQMKAGTLRPLVSTTEKRLPDYPDVPTMTEAGYPGVGTTLWAGLFAPAGTPQPVLETLQKAVAQALKSPQVLDAYAKQNVRAQPTESLDAAKTWLRGEIASWEKITKEIKIDLTD